MGSESQAREPVEVAVIHRPIPIVCLVFLLLGAAAPIRAQDAVVGVPDSEAIRMVITEQMDAFARDDGEAAFAFAAPIIRLKFGDAANFMTMVKTSFAAVYRPRKVTFGDLVLPELRLPVQRVYVVGPDGALLAFDYVMERQAAGDWRIAGVYLHHMPSNGPT